MQFSISSPTHTDSGPSHTRYCHCVHRRQKSMTQHREEKETRKRVYSGAGEKGRVGWGGGGGGSARRRESDPFFSTGFTRCVHVTESNADEDGKSMPFAVIVKETVTGF